MFINLTPTWRYVNMKRILEEFGECRITFALVWPTLKTRVQPWRLQSSEGKNRQIKTINSIKTNFFSLSLPSLLSLCLPPTPSFYLSHSLQHSFLFSFCLWYLSNIQINYIQWPQLIGSLLADIKLITKTEFFNLPTCLWYCLYIKGPEIFGYNKRLILLSVI